jgi:hypothetical protein
MPLPFEAHPRVVFERLFGDGGTPAEQGAQLRRRRSILDSVRGEMQRLDLRLGSGDRRTVREYFESVRDIEQRVDRFEAHLAEPEFALPEAPVDIPDSFDAHVKLMFDLQVLAFQADITRIITFQLSRELSPRTYPQIGVPEQHHGISHHQRNPEKLAQLTKINTYHVQLLAYFLERLRATPDGDGPLLDHVMILYGGAIGDGNTHDHQNLPCLVAGGGSGQLKGGRHVVYPLEQETPMSNLLVTLLDKLGVHVDTVGDSTGRVEGLGDL